MKKVLFISVSFSFTLLSQAQPYLFGTTQKGGIMYDGVVYSYNVSTKTYSKVVDFYGSNGAEPVGKLVLGVDQTIYGATARGGTAIFGRGVIYSISRTGGYKRLYTILEDSIPGQLIVASPTEFYANNDTAIYKFDTTTHVFEELYSFDPVAHGEFPGTLTVANNGILYGIRAYGFDNYMGELVSFNPNTSTFKVEYKFDQGPTIGNVNGTFPSADLLLAPNGLLYGATSDGGTNPGHGVIFTFDPATGIYSVKFTFTAYGPNGDRPNGSLQMGLDGKMYGFTSLGGAYDWGTAFSYSPTENTVTKLADLDEEFVFGKDFQTMLIASDGKFYATSPDWGAANEGTLFTYLPASKTFQTLMDFEDETAETGKYPVSNSLIEVAVKQTISCPGYQDITAGPNCATVVNGIDPVVFPASEQVSYSLINFSSGDTIGKGLGSVSGMNFNPFQTKVVYSIADQADISCSFIVTVLDKTPPELTVNDSVFHCFDDMTFPGSNKYTVPLAHAFENCAPAIAYRYLVKNSRGVVLRNGTTSNASGRFEEGRNTVEWAVSELYGSSMGNTAYDTTIVYVNPKLSANFTVVRPLIKGVASNTLYLGYSPASTARMEVTARSGSPAYSFKWSVAGSAVSYTWNPKNPTFIYLTAKQVGTSTFTAEVTDSRGCKFRLSRTFTVQDVRCDTNLDKVLVCRPTATTQTDCVNQSAVAAILNSGGSLGTCSITMTSMISKKEISSESKPGNMKLIVSPNPSGHEFTVTISTTRKETIRLRIIDEVGRIIEQREGVLPGSTIRIGDHYHRGLYICEAEQNGNRMQVRLIKHED